MIMEYVYIIEINGSISYIITKLDNAIMTMDKIKENMINNTYFPETNKNRYFLKSDENLPNNYWIIDNMKILRKIIFENENNCYDQYDFSLLKMKVNNYRNFKY